MQTLLSVILPVFLVIGAGYALTWRGMMTEAGIGGILKFAQGFAVPCLLFQAISKIDLNATLNPALLGSFYGGAIICFSIGMFAAQRVFKRTPEESVAIGFCCLFSNSVLLGLPITERAYGPDALVGNYAILAFHSPFCYGVGITVMEIIRNRGQSNVALAKAVLKAMFSNALVIGICLGFTVNILAIPIPGVLNDALDLITRSALPAALFALGGVLYQYRPEGDARVVAMICAMMLLVHPALTWIFGTLTALPNDLFRSAVLTAAMAPGFNAYIFANMYGQAKRVAASSVLIATAASILTAWFWLGVLG